MRRLTIAVLLPFLSCATLYSQAPQAGAQADLDAIRTQIQTLRADYDKRIAELEKQLAEVQTRMLSLAPEPAAGAAPAPAPPASAGALNPAIGVIGNFVGRGDNHKVYDIDGERIDNTLNLREVEMDIRVPVDPYADAVFIPSFESELPGKFEVGVEEAYVNIKKLPFMPTPLGLKFQVGRFRPSFARFNVLHTHDLPTTMRSLPTQEFLGEEGFVSQGVSTDFYIPTPWDDNQSLNGKVQVLTSGGVAISPFSHSRVSYLGNLRWFKTAGSHNTEIGWSSYWHPARRTSLKVAMHSLDFLYRWKPFRQGEWKSFLLGGEMMFSDKNHPDADEPPDVALNLDFAALSDKRPFGGSTFAQWQFDRRKYAGVRYDYTTTVIDPGVIRRSVTPYFSYYFSEFLRLRLNYEYRWSAISAENRRKSAFIELNWIFGAHPPEPFWVNR